MDDMQASGSLGIDPSEPRLRKIEPFDKDIDRANWITSQIQSSRH